MSEIEREVVMSQTTDALTGDVCYTIRKEECISCAACVSMAPSIFQMTEDGGPARLLRQPSTPEELREVEEAAATCPVQAIVRA
jgi:ferredoxin